MAPLPQANGKSLKTNHHKRLSDPLADVSRAFVPPDRRLDRQCGLGVEPGRDDTIQSVLLQDLTSQTQSVDNRGCAYASANRPE